MLASEEKPTSGHQDNVKRSLTEEPELVTACAGAGAVFGHRNASTSSIKGLKPSSILKFNNYFKSNLVKLMQEELVMNGDSKSN